MQKWPRLRNNSILYEIADTSYEVHALEQGMPSRPQTRQPDGQLQRRNRIAATQGD